MPAVLLWNLLGGYQLERLPLLAGLVVLDDWEMMVEQLRTIRDVTAEPQE